jgi:hypothetical protein
MAQIYAKIAIRKNRRHLQTEVWRFRYRSASFTSPEKEIAGISQKTVPGGF